MPRLAKPPKRILSPDAIAHHAERCKGEPQAWQQGYMAGVWSKSEGDNPFAAGDVVGRRQWDLWNDGWNAANAELKRNGAMRPQ